MCTLISEKLDSKRSNTAYRCALFDPMTWCYRKEKYQSSCRKQVKLK